MGISKQRVLGEIAVGTGLAFGLWTGYALVRGDSGSALEQWGVGLLLFGGATVWVLLTLRRAFRGALEAIRLKLAEVAANPSAKGGPFPGEQSGGFPEVGAVFALLQTVSAGYRKVLGDRVAQEETLDSLRAVLERAEFEKGKNVTVRGSGSSRNMVARLTPNLQWLAATPALQQFLGYGLADLNARPFLAFVHSEDGPGLKSAFEECLQTGEAHNITFRLLTRQDTGGVETPEEESSEGALPTPPVIEERHVQMDVTTRYVGDEPLHFRCFLLDVTARVRAEQALRRRTEELSEINDRLRRINQDLERLKESYRDLYHNAPVMYFSLDEQGHFVACNDTLVRSLGYPREAILGGPYTRLLTGEGRRRFLEKSDAYQRAGEVETQWVRRDGTVLDVWIRSTPVQDEQGRFLRSRSVAQDMTERNRLANELRRRGDELERTNVLLRRINRELDDFTYVVSHDLKEPLRTLEAFSNFLGQDYPEQLGAEGAEYINYLIQASRRLGTLIDDLLALSRAGRVIHAPVPFDPGATVATVCKDLGDLIQRKGAQVRVEGRLPRLVGDPLRANQLLSNLVGNGLKYNQSPRPEVVIGMVTGSEAKGRPAAGAEGSETTARGNKVFVTLFVRDNGIGIDPRYHEQIFGIFRRLHLREEYEGTGAGLAICKKIVEAHGGRIWVESELNRGATFFFTFPAAVPAAVGELAEENLVAPALELSPATAGEAS